MNTEERQVNNEAIAAAVSATINSDLLYIKRDIAEIKQRLDDRYVTNEQFLPVQRLVYGLVAIILSSVITAAIALIFIK